MSTTTAAVVAPLSSMAAGALIRWSLWWPHSDNRQSFASAATIVVVLVGSVALRVVLRTEEPQWRGVILLLVTVAGLIGAIVGFEVLRSGTAKHR